MSEDEFDEQTTPTEDDEVVGLPQVPEELQLDPILLALLHCAAFLDLGDEELVDPEAAGFVLDHVALYIRRLSPPQLEELQAKLDRLAKHAVDAEWPEEAQEFVGAFVSYCRPQGEIGEA